MFVLSETTTEKYLASVLRAPLVSCSVNIRMYLYPCALALGCLFKRYGGETRFPSALYPPNMRRMIIFIHSLYFASSSSIIVINMFILGFVDSTAKGARFEGGETYSNICLQGRPQDFKLGERRLFSNAQLKNDPLFYCRNAQNFAISFMNIPTANGNLPFTVVIATFNHHIFSSQKPR